MPWEVPYLLVLSWLTVLYAPLDASIKTTALSGIKAAEDAVREPVKKEAENIMIKDHK